MCLLFYQKWQVRGSEVTKYGLTPSFTKEGLIRKMGTFHSDTYDLGTGASAVSDRNSDF